MAGFSKKVLPCSTGLSRGHWNLQGDKCKGRYGWLYTFMRDPACQNEGIN